MNRKAISQEWKDHHNVPDLGLTINDGAVQVFEEGLDAGSFYAGNLNNCKKCADLANELLVYQKMADFFGITIGNDGEWQYKPEYVKKLQKRYVDEQTQAELLAAKEREKRYEAMFAKILTLEGDTVRIDRVYRTDRWVNGDGKRFDSPLEAFEALAGQER